MLPLEIQMQIDLTAAAHKRDIEEGFAKLRKKLLPDPRERSLSDMYNAVMGDAIWRHSMAALGATPTDMLTASKGQILNHYSYQNALSGNVGVSGWFGGASWF